MLSTFERNWVGFFEAVPNYYPGARFWHKDGIFYGLTGWHMAAFNVAIFEDAATLTMERLNVIEQTFEGKHFSVQFNRENFTSEHRFMLMGHDYIEIFDDPLMIRTGPFAPTFINSKISVKPVSSASEQTLYGELVAEGFGLPTAGEEFLEVLMKMHESWQMIAWLGQEPVGAGTVLFCNGAAGIYNMTTIPSARRQGVGTAIMFALHNEALARGYPGTALASSDMGFKLYQSLGYRLDGHQTGFTRTSSLQDW